MAISFTAADWIRHFLPSMCGVWRKHYDAVQLNSDASSVCKVLFFMQLRIPGIFVLEILSKILTDEVSRIRIANCPRGFAIQDEEFKMGRQNSTSVVTQDSQLVKTGKLVVGVVLVGVILVSYGMGATFLLDRLASEISSMPPVDMSINLAGLR